MLAFSGTEGSSDSFMEKGKRSSSKEELSGLAIDERTGEPAIHLHQMTVQTSLGRDKFVVARYVHPR